MRHKPNGDRQYDLYPEEDERDAEEDGKTVKKRR